MCIRDSFSNGLQSVFPRLGARLARRVLFRRVREQALGTEPMFCISGGGFLQPQAAELMNGLGYGMHNGYGMTETGILSAVSYTQLDVYKRQVLHPSEHADMRAAVAVDTDRYDAIIGGMLKRLEKRLRS